MWTTSNRKIPEEHVGKITGRTFSITTDPKNDLFSFDPGKCVRDGTRRENSGRKLFPENHLSEKFAESPGADNYTRCKIKQSRVVSSERAQQLGQTQLTE